MKPAAFAILFSLFVAVPSWVTATSPLHIVGLFPLTSVPGWLASLSTQCLVAIDMAIEDINNREDLLAEYELTFVHNDTRGSQGIALNLLYDHLYSPPTKIAVFGEIMSSITEPTAEVTGLWHVLQFAFATSSMRLSDRNTYPHFFRTTTSAADMNPAIRDIMYQFGWYRVATLHETVEPHSGVTNNLLSVLESTNISVEAAESFLGDPREALQRLKAKDMRIVVINVYESTARQVFCQAHKLGMFGQKYAWFLPGYYSLNWWQRVGAGINCTVAEMEEVIDGYLTVTFSMNSLDDDVTVSGQTPPAFRARVRDALGEDVDFGQSPAANAYDSTWATAFALNDSLSDIEPKTLNMFEYFNEEMTDTFTEKMEALSFEGVSGPISFKGADRQGPFLIEQWRVLCISQTRTLIIKPHHDIFWCRDQD
ncbi:gamma-aminobutyric acid type B receptor subunit 1-like [Ptychodera flava]|uniref:gamma-aminobutyric acid type B receptor subunit 1-like n=1 Tax=Ptychodera flava TaxID=63121 RepID=UPI003969F4A0